MYDVNERIRLPKVIVIDENGENLGLIDRDAAINIARERELDLVLVSPNSENPVARIVDWAKFKYEKSKKAKKNKGKALETKEWRFTGLTQEFEMNLKLKRVKEFLAKGGNAKLTIRSERKVQREDMLRTFNILRNKYLEFASEVAPMSNVGRDLTVVIKNK